MVNTTGSNNTALGYATLGGSQNVGDANTAVGSNALDAVTTAGYNCAFGKDALGKNTAGNNTAFGTEALRENTSGTKNTAFGNEALRDNTGSNKPWVVTNPNSTDDGRQQQQGSSVLISHTESLLSVIKCFPPISPVSFKISGK